LAARDGGARNKYEDLEILETLEFVAGASDPILSIRRS
jgi:hypothetical protein